MRNKAIACLGAIVACATALAGIPATAMADDSAGLTPQYTYNSQNFPFLQIKRQISNPHNFTIIPNIQALNLQNYFIML